MVHLQGNSLYFVLAALRRRKELRWDEGRGLGDGRGDNPLQDPYRYLQLNGVVINCSCSIC